jgi:hypothetical protein
MATVLEACAIEEQRYVLRFLWAEGLSAKYIHKEMFPFYGGKCLSRKAVHNWIEVCSKVTFESHRWCSTSCGSG